MQIIVGDPPCATAWLPTADIPEQQALIGGRHHILWLRVSPREWVVTAPDRRLGVIHVNPADVVTLGRGVAFPRSGRPFFALPALSALDWETLRGEALSLGLRIKADPPPPLPPPSGHVSVAACWRTLRADEEFVYDHRTRAPEVPGYAVDLVLSGHVSCRCDRSRWVKWFLPHSVNRRTWPWAFPRVELYVSDLLRSQPDYVALGHSSCGFIVTVDMSRRSGRMAFRTPTLDRRAASRLRLLTEMAASAEVPSAARPIIATLYHDVPPAPPVPVWAADHYSDRPGERGSPGAAASGGDSLARGTLNMISEAFGDGDPTAAGSAGGTR